MQSDVLIDRCNKIDRKENDSDNGENDDNHKIMPSFFLQIPQLFDKSAGFVQKVRDLARTTFVKARDLSEKRGNPADPA